MMLGEEEKSPGDNSPETAPKQAELKDSEHVVIVEGTVEVEEPSTEDKKTKDEEVSNSQKVAEEDHTDAVSTKRNRELLSILALSKEAKLDTNIIRKRKSVEPGSSNKQILTEKAELTNKLKLKEAGLDSQDNAETLNEEVKEKEENGSNKMINNKKKRESLHESSIGGALEGLQGKRNGKLLKNMIIIHNDKRYDPFCWQCHHVGVSVFCETCPRSFHPKCVKHHGAAANKHWICPECATILKAENLKQRSAAMRDMSLENLCELLKFALKTIHIVGCEPFIHPVNEQEFPEYKNYIVQPMNLTMLEKNIKDNVYGSPQAFEADTKWLLHNSIIFNSYQSKLSLIAKSIVKICKQEMSEIENCANCYRNANTKKNTWFLEVCPKPHLLVWAKLKGFPYWPAKVMRSNAQGFVDVRFFGAHDRAWIPYKDCYLYSTWDPNPTKVKRNNINECIKELNIHIENLEKVYGVFRTAPVRTLLDPNREVEQWQLMMPNYSPEKSMVKRTSSRNGSLSWSDSDTSMNKSEQEAKDGNSDHEMDEDKNQSSSEPDDHDKQNESQSDDASLKSDENADSCSFLSNSSVRRCTVRMRGGFTNTSGKIKVIPKILSPERVEKRPSLDDTGTPPKISRRNSDISVQSDSSRVSNISDKINRVDICENMEISIIAKDVSVSEESSKTDFVAEPKNKPVQIDMGGIENAEISISPQSKSKMADWLMKKLTASPDDKAKKKILVEDVVDSNINETELLLGNFKDKSLTVLEKITELSPDVEIFETNAKDSHTNTASDDLEMRVEEKSDIEKTNKEIIKEPVMEPNLTNTENADTTKNVDETPKNNTDETRELILISEIVANNDTTSDNITDNTDNAESKGNKFGVKNMSVVLEKLTEPTSDNNTQVTNHLDLKKVDNKTKNVDKVTPNIIKLKQIESKPAAPTKKIQSSGEATAKRKRSCEEPDSIRSQQKFVKVVNIEDIKNKKVDSIRLIDKKSILENRLQPTQAPSDARQITNAMTPFISELTSIVVKSEPSSDDESSDTEYMAMKRRYLSALNLNESDKPLDKPKQNEMRTRSKTEEIKSKAVDNLSKVIDEVATHCGSDPPKEATGKSVTNIDMSKRKEVFIKPLAKMQIPKQRARKSFPLPVAKSVYPAAKKEGAKFTKPMTSHASIFKSNATGVPIITAASKPMETLNNSGNIMFLAQPPAISSSLAVLPPNQPISYTANLSNPVLTMVQHPITQGLNNFYIQQTSMTTPSTSTTSASQSATSMVHIESQNYIPQNGAAPKPARASKTSSDAPPIILNSSLDHNMPTLSPLTVERSAPQNGEVNASNASSELMEDLQVLSSFVPDALTKAIGDVMCRAPPKLKPRPPGPLSAQFDSGYPSGAGIVTSKVNAISHRLNDYFRGMLVELLHELGESTCAEGEVIKLKLENEEMKHKHAEEMLEIKKNVGSILKDMQKSLAEERARAIEETRGACEAECLKRVEEAKSKQWCANCSKEAQFYCCWNTSYCDYPCQQKHWPKHMSKCTQNIQSTQQLQTSSAVLTTKPQQQPIVLRPMTAPKGFGKTLIGKPTKVFVNRSGNNKNSYNVVKTSSGNHITLVEATPGNFELVGNGPISIGGKFLTSMGKIKSTNVVSVTSPSSSSSTMVSHSGQKTIVLSQSKPPTVTILPKPTNKITVLSDDELE